MNPTNPAIFSRKLSRESHSEPCVELIREEKRLREENENVFIEELCTIKEKLAILQSEMNFDSSIRDSLILGIKKEDPFVSLLKQVLVLTHNEIIFNCDSVKKHSKDLVSTDDLYNTMAGLIKYTVNNEFNDLKDDIMRKNVDFMKSVSGNNIDLKGEIEKMCDIYNSMAEKCDQVEKRNIELMIRMNQYEIKMTDLQKKLLF